MKLADKHVVVTGPLMAKGRIEGLRDLARGLSVTIMPTIDDLTTLMAAADLVITMAAYNTLTDAIRLKRPILSVPRLGPSAEQVMRARLLEERKLLTRVAAEADPRQMAAAIDLALTKPRLVGPPPTLDGLERTIADYIAGMTDRYAIQEHRRLFDPSVRV